MPSNDAKQKTMNPEENKTPPGAFTPFPGCYLTLTGRSPSSVSWGGGSANLVSSPCWPACLMIKKQNDK